MRRRRSRLAHWYRRSASPACFRRSRRPNRRHEASSAWKRLRGSTAPSPGKYAPSPRISQGMPKALCRWHRQARSVGSPSAFSIAPQSEKSIFSPVSTSSSRTHSGYKALLRSPSRNHTESASHSPTASMPAAACVAPLPGARASIRLTFLADFASCRAMEAPMIPAPTTVTGFALMRPL